MESHDPPTPTPEGRLIRLVRDSSVPKLTISAAAGRIGLSTEQWGYVERGHRPARAGEAPRPFSPPAPTLARMAHALGISPERLESEGQRPDAAAVLRDLSPRKEAHLRRIRPFIPYEIALGDGESARLVLPQDLTGEEADRLCGVIRSLAFS